MLLPVSGFHSPSASLHKGGMPVGVGAQAPPSSCNPCSCVTVLLGHLHLCLLPLPYQLSWHGLRHTWCIPSKPCKARGVHTWSAHALSQVFQDLCHLYLGSQKHKLLPEAMRLISEEGVQITPADVTGILDADRQDPTAALQHAVKHLSGLLHKQQQQQQQQSQSQKLSEGTAANGDRHA